jgi:hypothetical protein
VDGTIGGMNDDGRMMGADDGQLMGAEQKE